jgi:hypothetical protein
VSIDLYSPLDPDELYGRVLEGLNDQRKLSVLMVDESKRYIQLGMFETGKRNYFELHIFRDGSESHIEIAAEPEYSTAISKAGAVLVKSVYKHLF